jgi:hypothetical protein
MSAALTTRQQLRAAAKLAAAFPLFAEELAPELPELAAHVATHGNKDIAPPAKFEVGQRVHNLNTVWNNQVYTGTIKSRVPSWSYDGRFSRWFYYLAYDEGQIKPGLHHLHQLPAWEERLTAAPLPPTKAPE